MIRIIYFIATLIMFSSIMYADTLENVTKRDYVKCGINNSQSLGFSAQNKRGKWEGLNIDYCKALAAAVLGDANKVKFIPMATEKGFISLRKGVIDILSRSTTLSVKRNIFKKVNFAGIIFYDIQGFLAKKSLNLENAKKIDGERICVIKKSMSKNNVDDFFIEHAVHHKIITYDNTTQIKYALEDGKCDIYSDNQSKMQILQTTLKNPSDYIMLPDIVAKKPLGPVVMENDRKWTNITRWVLYAMIEAEEKGINQANVSQKINSKDSTIQRFLGSKDNISKNLHINKKWAYNILKQVGNYNDIFERNLGQKSKFKLSRGLNSLWNAGGLMYSMPIK